MRHAPAFFLFVFAIALTLGCGGEEKTAEGYEDRLAIMSQVNGPGTNSYLLYSTKTKEAAVIDIGGEVDEILNVIEKHSLEVKHIFFTHGHFDHVMGYPGFAVLFPKAKVAMHRGDYEDMFTQRDWIVENMPPEFVERLKNNPTGKIMYDFEPESIAKPDLWLEGGETFQIGGNVIRTVHTPGHSRGSMCYQVNNRLFSGDLLFDGTVGRTDLQNSSFEELVVSVRGLYHNLPDETIVHPGHGPSTTIGAEKEENAVVTIDTFYVDRAR